MQCSECAELALKRDRLWRAYCHSITVLGSSDRKDVSEQARLQAAVEQARSAFNQAATALYQHQHDSHSVPD
jgi:hypothetical protein